ncbi:hypothetical protein CHLRE_16g665800v5 [Chlamydomonas reinhardtii]|uniref:Starch synthase, chloroplastic/amyloplastic n=1 Tax=Chlamydomonas reinhardtii TaxID=3055 RepID=O64927_CHLRE|nr:uncharacterized protein CHLRE_16g665800v5 [Chlamydomonas reinhardtii]AAC17971.2 soluble starch synthase [Chlamydomonas reinhardtii]PNW71709.1 hypothetical protein CHLRE_16g665800v5 [Chlamydomonas reinhardtii]|eukprot:XP_001701469.1 soluble starch synthase [Chlamydomonas reinhardtii]
MKSFMRRDALGAGLRGAASTKPVSRVASVRPAPTAYRTACQVAKVDEMVSVDEELTRLRKENELLRAQLALYQQNQQPSVGAAAVAPPAAATKVLEKPAPAKQASVDGGIIWPKPGEAFWERSPRASPMPLQGGAAEAPPVERDGNPMHIIHITAEMAPIAKVGGLGDVVTGLAKAALARGHFVTVMLPFYECLPKDQIEGLKHECDIEVPKGYRWDGEIRVGPLKTSVFWGRVQGCPVYLIKPADDTNCNIFRGGRIYGGSYNEMEAYLYFCRACLEYLNVSQQNPHVLQLHDWHAAAASMLYWDVYNPNGFSRTRLMLTIHNLDNTGETRQDEFFFTGVPGENFATIDKALDERTIGHNPERLNLMKGGIVYCNAVTTVSPTYANEVLNGGAAGWLRSTFARPELRSKFHGILNGIDCEEWNPATDALLPANFDADRPAGKALCKEFLQKGLGLEVDPRKPLVAVVSRLVPQKGIHLIKAALFRTVEKGGQFVLLGSGHSDPAFRQLADGQFKDHPNCRLKIMYSERLAHMIYAAADVVVVPSMFEPCGLTQMIALRYGAVPLVRRTGGLADTVFDVDGPAGGPAQPRNGFVFDGSDDGALHGALDRALTLYTTQPERWAALQQDNMRLDVSWGKSAKSYVDVYRSISA